MRRFVLVALVAACLGGCSLLPWSNKATFEVEGTTYKDGAATCTRRADRLHVDADQSPAHAEVDLQPTAQRAISVRMGAEGQATMVMDADHGDAALTVDGKRYRITGNIARVDRQGGVTDQLEPFTFTVTCNSYQDN